MGAGDVAGSAGAGTDTGGGFHHGADHFRVLPHPEIVVGAPDHDVARALRGVPHRVREATGDALEIGENPVAPLVMQAVEGGTEELAIIHRKTACQGNWGRAAGLRESCLVRALPALLSSRNRIVGNLICY